MPLHGKTESFCKRYFWSTKRKSTFYNYGTMVFMSKQGSLPKISLIVQKMKIGQNSIYTLFAWSPSDAMVNDSRIVTDNSKDGIHNYLFQVTLAKNLLRQYPASKVLFSGPWQVSDQDLSLSLYPEMGQMIIPNLRLRLHLRFFEKFHWSCCYQLLHGKLSKFSHLLKLKAEKVSSTDW